MRDVIFLNCAPEAAREARRWARAALLEAGLAQAEARAGALRLAAGFRAAARAFSGRRAQARPAHLQPACVCGGPPKAMLLLTDDETGALAFELIADGDAPAGTLGREGAAGRLWAPAERRVAGDGATRLRMPARR